jgi:hypothetical protein
MNPIYLSEIQVRRLRDLCFGRRSTDNNWLACRDYWMRIDSIEWLLKHSYPLSP